MGRGKNTVDSLPTSTDEKGFLFYPEWKMVAEPSYGDGTIFTTVPAVCLSDAPDGIPFYL